MGYLVKLQTFEGPLDLLLHLIKKHEMDIYDIPIAQITKQYLAYLTMMEQFDMEVASEFIVMASTLMYIKSKMLIPREVVSLTEEVEEDPRSNLVDKLLEYQRYKQIAYTLVARELEESEYFPRASQNFLLDEKPEEVYLELNLLELVKAFNQLINLIDHEPSLPQVVIDDININYKMEELLHLMQYKNMVNFTELFKKMTTRREIVATLLALLELMKSGQLQVTQIELFGEIRGYPAQLSLEVA